MKLILSIISLTLICNSSMASQCPELNEFTWKTSGQTWAIIMELPKFSCDKEIVIKRRWIDLIDSRPDYQWTTTYPKPGTTLENTECLDQLGNQGCTLKVWIYEGSTSPDDEQLHIETRKDGRPMVRISFERTMHGRGRPVLIHTHSDFNSKSGVRDIYYPIKKSVSSEVSSSQ